MFCLDSKAIKVWIFMVFFILILKFYDSGFVWKNIFSFFFSQKIYGFCLCTIILTLWLIKSSFFLVGLELFNPWWFWIGLYPIWWCYSYSNFGKNLCFFFLLLCFVDYCKKELTLSFIVYGYFFIFMVCVEIIFDDDELTMLH